MDVIYLQTEDLVFAHEAEAATGVPQQVIRKWASRGRIQRFNGDGRPHGRGHFARTMYALPEVEHLARSYRPTPQRAPQAA